MDTLRLVLSKETAEKLERLVTMDQRFQPMMGMLELATLVIFSLEMALRDMPLNGPQDLGSFVFEGLDLVWLTLGEELAKIFPENPTGRYLAFLEHNDYRASEDYAERRARIMQAGRYGLLLRVAWQSAEGQAKRRARLAEEEA